MHVYILNPARSGVHTWGELFKYGGRANVQKMI
jgi:hypothetical protein